MTGHDRHMANTNRFKWPTTVAESPSLVMSKLGTLSTVVFPSKYWVFPIAFAGLPWIVWRIMPPSIFRYLNRFVAVGRSKEEEEAERAREELLKKLQDALKDAAEEKQRLKADVDRLSAERQASVDESKSLKTERDALKQALEDAKRRADAEHRRWTDECGALKRRLDGKDVELRSLGGELQHARTKHDELTTLLEARTRELKGAQVYLTKADTLSGAEVISLIDALNVEILQTAAFISDSFDFARHLANAEETKEAGGRISELMGPTLTHLLGTVLHSEDPLLVQIALQGATVEFSRWIIMTWDFDGLQAEQPLAEIYNDIRETEPQAVGGRWRALTRAHAQKVAMQEADLHATMVSHISDTLVIILVAAGCTKNYEDTYRMFTQKFGERVSNIVKMASRLNKAMGEEVTSADLWPLNTAAGDKFSPSTMDNFESSGDDLEGKTVLCTTALGLQRSEKVVVDDKVEFKSTMLLKPKVAIETIADVLERDGA